MVPFCLKSSRIRTRCPHIYPSYNVSLCWYPQTHKAFWEYAVDCLLSQTLCFSLCIDILICSCGHVTPPLCKGVGGTCTRAHAHAHTQSCSASKKNKKGQQTTATHSLDEKKKSLLGSTESQDPASYLRESWPETMMPGKLPLLSSTVIIPQLVWEERAWPLLHTFQVRTPRPLLTLWGKFCGLMLLLERCWGVLKAVGEGVVLAQHRK